jgi:hypothetical protein
MPNEAGRAYGLTALCPLINDTHREESVATLVRAQLRSLTTDENSVMAKVPNTYLCRMFVLDDVMYQGYPEPEEHLASKYLVFVADIHGRLRPYLEGMWQAAQPLIRDVFRYCVGFSEVDGSDAFVRYIQRCQVTTTFYFNGSNDEPLVEQLKALYLKQELSRFACEQQGKDPAQVQAAFREFVSRVQPENLAGPTFRPGATSLANAIKYDDGRA